MADDLSASRLEDIVRVARPRLIALLAAADGDLAAAEDAFSDSVEQALVHWPREGVPGRPEAWLLTVARNRRRDRWRSDRRTAPLPDEVNGHAPPTRHLRRSAPRDLNDGATALPDRRLALLAVAAHPAIDPAARTPLMLNTVLGLTAEKIGALLLVPAATMSARLTRAKKRIRDSGLDFEEPGIDELPARLESIRAAIHGAYSVEWTYSPAGTHPGLTDEALFLAELLTELVPTDPESHGLAALLCLSAARADARHDDLGYPVPIEDQDTTRWDSVLLARGEEHLRLVGTDTTPGPYLLQAAIQAVHCARRRTGWTDWESLRGLHAGLAGIAPTVGGAVAEAVVIGRCDGPGAGLDALDRIGPRARGFQPALAVRARLLADAGRTDAALRVYEEALAVTVDPADRRFLDRARRRLREGRDGCEG